MSAKKNKSPLALDMEFGEALARLANTDPKQLNERLERKRGLKTTPSKPEPRKNQST